MQILVPSEAGWNQKQVPQVLVKFARKALTVQRHKNVFWPWPVGSVGWSIVSYTKKFVGLVPGQDTYPQPQVQSPVGPCTGGN